MTACFDNSSGKGEELKVWSLPDCRGKRGKIKETCGMSSAQEQEAFVRLQRPSWAGSYIASAAVRCLYKGTSSCSPASSSHLTPESPR